MDADARTRIIQLFEKHRAAPGAPYDEGHFLDFLLRDPKKERAVYNSFSGLRRFNAFLDEVQYELGVCFSLDDRDANYRRGCRSSNRCAVAKEHRLGAYCNRRHCPCTRYVVLLVRLEGEGLPRKASSSNRGSQLKR